MGSQKLRIVSLLPVMTLVIPNQGAWLIIARMTKMMASTKARAVHRPSRPASPARDGEPGGEHREHQAKQALEELPGFGDEVDHR